MRLASTVQNEKTPISKLPAETFLHICKLACPQKTRRSIFDVIALTHVCRRWRDALLSYPIIWSCIYVLHDSPLVTTVLQRSQGVPLTVNIWYSSRRAIPPSCSCTRYSAWEDGNYCTHTSKRTSSLDFLEPFRIRIHTLNVRYLRDDSFGSNGMEDILDTPFFLGPLPNLESLRWSCGRFRETDRTGPISTLPRKLFGLSLPRLQKLSMVNCWGLAMTDTPALKVVSVEFTALMNQAEISARQPVHWLRHRQSLTSFSLTNCRIGRNAKNTPGPVSMKKLEEVTLWKVSGGVVSHHIRCPSIRRIVTFRVALFTQAI